MHPRVPFSGKVDDDTAPNLRVLVPFLERLRCAETDPMLFIGAINWASYVPRSADFGVRGDRCGFGWSLHASLTNFGNSPGVPFRDDLGVRLSGPACACVFFVAMGAFSCFDEATLFAVRTICDFPGGSAHV